MTTWALCFFGLLLGARHATEPDHLVAAMAMTSRTRGWLGAASTGATWAIGHSIPIVLAGIALVAFGLVVPPALRPYAELPVAAMLVLLGVRNLRLQQAHAHAHAGAPPFAVGLVHGLAGSASVTLILVAAEPSPWSALVRLGAFTLGTLIGMTVCSVLASASFARLSRSLVVRSTGVLSVVTGMVLIGRFALER